MLRGHSGVITVICAYTYDAIPYLASASDDGTARVWDPATGECLHTITGPVSRVPRVMRLSQDGTAQPAQFTGRVLGACGFTGDGGPRLALSGDDGTVTVWDPAAGTRLHTFRRSTNAGGAVCAVDLDGTTHLAVSDGDNIQVWNPLTSEIAHSLYMAYRPRGSYPDPNDMCTWTASGTTFLAAGLSTGAIQVWDLATGERLYVLLAAQRPVFSLCAFTRDGATLLASGSGDATIRIWDPATGECLSTLTGHEAGVKKPMDLGVTQVLPFAQDGTTHLASSGRDGTVRVWDLATGSGRTVAAHERYASVIGTLSVGGAPLLATAHISDAMGGAATIQLLDPAASAPAPGGDPVSAICVLPHGGPATAGAATRLATAGGEGIRIRNPATGTVTTTLAGHAPVPETICALDYQGTPRVAFVERTGGRSTVRVCDLATGATVSSYDWPDATINAICPYPFRGDPHLAIVSTRTTFGDGGKMTSDTTIRVWNPATGAIAQTFAGKNDYVTGACAFTLDGATALATIDAATYVRIWKPDRNEIHTLFGHRHRCIAVCAFTLDGTPMLASTSNDATVRIWDAAAAAGTQVLTGHQGRITGVCAFALGGTTLLATSGLDATVRIWNPATGAAGPVIPVQDPASAVAYADGLLLAGTSAGLLAFRVDPESLPR